jgi:hypothetical protein
VNSISDTARPPIQSSEIKDAREANCPRHGGYRDGSERDGEVFLCGVGRQYWRYSTRDQGMYGRLAYPKSGVV